MFRMQLAEESETVAEDLDRVLYNLGSLWFL